MTRGAAYVVDLFVMALACIVANQTLELTVEFFRLGTFTLGARILPMARAAIVVVILALYLPLCWTFTGSSVGKALFGLCVVRANGKRLTFVRSLLRFACYWLSALPLGLGFISVATDPQRRALHDKLTGTRVVYASNARR